MSYDLLHHQHGFWPFDLFQNHSCPPQFVTRRKITYRFLHHNES